MVVAGGVMANPGDEDSQTIAVVSEGDGTTSLALAGVLSDEVNDSQVVMAGNSERTYRSGITASNLYASDRNRDISTVVGFDAPKTARVASDLLGGSQDSDGNYLYEHAYNHDPGDVGTVETSAQLAQDYYNSADEAVVANVSNEAAVVRASYTHDGPVLLVNGDQDLDEVDNALEQLSVSNISVGSSVSSDTEAELNISARNVTDWSDDLNSDASSYGSTSNLYVVDSVDAASALVDSAGEDDRFFIGNSSTVDGDLPSSQNVYQVQKSGSGTFENVTQDESIDYSSIRGLSVQSAHDSLNITKATPVVSDVEAEDGNATVTVSNVGTSSAGLVNVTVGNADGPEVWGSEHDETYENGSNLKVEFDNIESGESVTFKYAHNGQDIDRDNLYVSGSSEGGASAVTYTSFPLSDTIPSETILGFTEAAQGIAQNLSLMMVLLILLVGVVVAGGVWYVKFGGEDQQ